MLLAFAKAFLRCSGSSWGDGAIEAPGLKPGDRCARCACAKKAVWYRIFMSAVLRPPAIRDWSVAIAPDQCHGALRGRSVSAALGHLAVYLENNLLAIALDFSKCFDSAHPLLALELLRQHQWPGPLLGLLEHVWCNQQCFLQLGRTFDRQCADVCSALPQGDPASPLKLMLIFIDAVRDVSTSTQVVQSIYIDDRLLVADTVRQALQAKQLWQHWRHRLGLRENLSKLKALAWDYHQRMDLLRRGVPQQSVVSELTILGAPVQCDDRQLSITRQQRLHAALYRSERIVRAPGHLWA